jgi:arylsulfatase A-like enzyme
MNSRADTHDQPPIHPTQPRDPFAVAPNRITTPPLCMRRLFLLLLFLAFTELTKAAPPNIIYIMSDELGYFEPGFNGGTTIQTPNLDRLAAQGIRFTNLFAGSSVCAPTRCCLLTGKHTGHSSVRVNGGGTPLRANETTIASMLKPLGYAVGGFGKWGCGGRDSTGVPEKHGFDVFFGYYDQVHAHSYYPPYLIRNSEEVPLKGNHGVKGETYSHYQIHQVALNFIRENSQKPFFAYLPYTPPHGGFQIPDEDPAWSLYKDKPWSEPARRYAAMVGMVDRQVGEIVELLRELGIEKNTLLMFSGDNGGADYFVSPEYPRGVHSANKNPKTGVEYRGSKGSLYEGGLRIPFFAYWPGSITPGSVSNHLAYFPDILPTIAAATGIQPPSDTDGISILPTLLGRTGQAQHEFLYWEMGSSVAIRQGNWRAFRPGKTTPWELYDVSQDPSESKNLATEHPEIISKLSALAANAHTDAVEGTFSRTDRHQRDRRAKMGQQDNPDAPDPLTGKKKPLSNAAAFPKEGLLTNTDWKIARVSSENTANKRIAQNAIDGNPDTHWHSRFSPDVAAPPHELVIDLGSERLVRGFVYLARQDAGWNGAIDSAEFAVGNTPESLNTVLLKTHLSKTKNPQVIRCEPTKGRYVLLRALSEHGGHSFASVAEFGVLGE